MANQKRRRFWVDPPLQFQLLTVIMSLVLASIFLLAYSVFHGLEEASLASHQIFHSTDWLRHTVRGPMIVSASIAVLASGLITLVWSHRFAAPLRVLAAAMERLGQGDFSGPVRIRKSDAQQEVIREFAQMQEHLRLKLDADFKALEAAAQGPASSLVQEVQSLRSRYKL